MITAIIFDCFGVLATDGWLPFRQRNFGHDPRLLREAIDLNKRVDAGFISVDEFTTRISKLAGISEQATRAELEHNLPDAELLGYIKDELKPHYKLGVLSNTGHDWLAEIFTPEQVALFDAVSLSYETGFVKPDLRAYVDIAEKLKTETRNCVFTDDQPRCVAGAQEAGVQAILYQSFAQFWRELEQVLAG